MPSADAQSMLERLEAAGRPELARALRRALSSGAAPPFALSWGGARVAVTEDWQTWEMAGDRLTSRFDRVPAQDDSNERKRRSFRCDDTLWNAISEPKATEVERYVREGLIRDGRIEGAGR
jgi:hypothetical protein